MIHVAEPWRKNLAFTCTNIHNYLKKKKSPSQGYLKKRVRKLTFLQANKADNNNVKLFPSLKLVPNKLCVSFLSLEFIPENIKSII